MHAAPRKTSARDVIWCRKCGKTHRIREYPINARGDRLPQFLFTCIQCGKTEIRDADEILRPARNSKL